MSLNCNKCNRVLDFKKKRLDFHCKKLKYYFFKFVFKKYYDYTQFTNKKKY